MKAAGVRTDDAGDLVKWRFNTEVTDPGYSVKEAKEKEIGFVFKTNILIPNKICSIIIYLTHYELEIKKLFTKRRQTECSLSR